MYITIIGGGGVGFDLARSLSEKDHDVVVFEKNPELAHKLSECLDVMVYEENGANAAALERARIKSAEMLIAVTEVDEINIIACMLAKSFGVPITVGRVRNADYLDGAAVLPQEKIGIDIIINPERAAAQEISKMLYFPDAGDIEYFNRGRVMMLGITAEPETEIVSKPLQEVPLPPGCIVVGISRSGGRFFIPGGGDVIEPGDKAYLLGSAPVLKDISWLLHHEKTRLRKIVILGGGMIGLQLAQLLENSSNPYSVTMVEQEEERCQLLSRHLSHCLVLQGDATDLSFFEEEDMENADAVVAVTGDDRTNIVAAVLAKQLGVKKIISEVKNTQYVKVFQTLGIDSIINTRLAVAAQILRFTRREDVVALSILKDENAEVLELVLPESARLAYKRVAEVDLPRGVLIGSIMRGKTVFVPHGKTQLMPGDHLVVFALPSVSKSLDRYFAADNENQDEHRQKLMKLQEN